jgi:hypothetical protein
MIQRNLGIFSSILVSNKLGVWSAMYDHDGAEYQVDLSPEHKSAPTCLPVRLHMDFSHAFRLQTAPKTLSNNTPAKISVPGLPVHQLTLFPLLLSIQPPASPTTSSSSSPFPSLTGLPLRSATIHPRVHCPLVSTLRSSVLNSHFGSEAVSAYQMVSGSCSWRPRLDGSCCGFRDAFFWKVAVRKRVDHSARGEPAMGGDVVWDLKSFAGRRWGSVISTLY